MMPWDGVISLVNTAVTRIWPDKTEQDKMQLTAALQQMQNEYDLAQGQIEINKVEAASTSFFVSGGRPFIIWVGGVSLALVYIPKAIVLSVMWTYQAAVIVHLWNGMAPFPVLPPYPDLGVTDLLGLLGSILGLGWGRTAEKIKGVARDTL